MTSLPCIKFLLKGLVFKGLHKGVGSQLSQGIILKTTVMIINEIKKTQEKMGVVFVGLINGGGIVLATTKPHESQVNVKGNIQTIEPRAMPSQVQCGMPLEHEVLLIHYALALCT